MGIEGRLMMFMAFLVCFAIACLCTIIFDCPTVQAAWSPALRADPGTRCFLNSTFSFIGLFNSIVNICTNVLFALPPIPIIVKLQVNTRTKVTLAGILSVGFVACAAAIIKAKLQTKFITEPDGDWHDGFNVRNMLELCLGILAALLPSLKPLFSRLFESTKTALGRSTGTQGGLARYKWQYDPCDFYTMLPDIHLRDFKKDPSATAVECSAHLTDMSAVEQDSSAKKSRPYNVRITSATFPCEEYITWQEVEFGRSDS